MIRTEHSWIYEDGGKTEVFAERVPVSRLIRLDSIRLDQWLGYSLFGPDASRPSDGPFVSHDLMPSHGSPVTLLAFQAVPTLKQSRVTWSSTNHTYVGTRFSLNCTYLKMQFVPCSKHTPFP